MIVARGVAGFGAGGEYPTSGSSATEAADETEKLRKQRGILVAVTTDFAVDLGFVIAGVVALIVLACYGQKNSEGVWRITFGLGFVVSTYPPDILTYRHGPVLMLSPVAPGYLFLPYSHAQLDSVPKTCDQIKLSLHAGSQALLEAHAGHLIGMVCL